jgi:hypothetical protein
MNKEHKEYKLGDLVYYSWATGEIKYLGIVVKIVEYVDFNLYDVLLCDSADVETGFYSDELYYA